MSWTPFNKNTRCNICGNIDNSRTTCNYFRRYFPNQLIITFVVILVEATNASIFLAKNLYLNRCKLDELPLLHRYWVWVICYNALPRTPRVFANRTVMMLRIFICGTIVIKCGPNGISHFFDRLTITSYCKSIINCKLVDQFPCFYRCKNRLAKLHQTMT